MRQLNLNLRMLSAVSSNVHLPGVAPISKRMQTRGARELDLTFDDIGRKVNRLRTLL